MSNRSRRYNQHKTRSKAFWPTITTATVLWLCSLSAVLSANTSMPKEVNINGVEFIQIPAGWYYKARNKSADPEPKIWLDSYYIGKYEARAQDLVAFLNSKQGKDINYDGIGKSCSVGQEADGSYIQFRPDDNLPATHLSWEQANQWALWMGFRLPTEMEWERAARGDDKRIFPWGNAFPDETYLNFLTHSKCSVEQVDSYKKGISPYGAYNMAGNVYEYVADWVNTEYDLSLVDGMRNPTPASQGTTYDDKKSGSSRGPWKILKGGRWGSDADYVRIGSRMEEPPKRSWRCNGTRFALNNETVAQYLQQGKAQVITP